jgi:hypothetical protein
MDPIAWTHALRTRSSRLQMQSRRLMVNARELVHDARNLLLQGKLRRLRRRAPQAAPVRRAA